VVGPEVQTRGENKYLILRKKKGEEARLCRLLKSLRGGNTAGGGETKTRSSSLEGGVKRGKMKSGEGKRGGSRGDGHFKPVERPICWGKSPKRRK